MPLTRSADGSLGVRVTEHKRHQLAAVKSILPSTSMFLVMATLALNQAMEQAAAKGARDGAKQARQEMLVIFRLTVRPGGCLAFN
jgi:hypothetical protein